MANIITSIRIICSIALLFSPAISPVFYVLYIVAGFTDMIDGTVARKTNTASEFGSKLDTIADFIFVVACLIKLLPVMDIPVWLYAWIGIIALIKIINAISGYVVATVAAVQEGYYIKTGVEIRLWKLWRSSNDIVFNNFKN